MTHYAHENAKARRNLGADNVGGGELDSKLFKRTKIGFYVNGSFNYNTEI